MPPKYKGVSYGVTDAKLLFWHQLEQKQAKDIIHVSKFKTNVDTSCCCKIRQLILIPVQRFLLKIVFKMVGHYLVSSVGREISICLE